MTPEVIKCQRNGCGRPLRSAASIARKMSARCFAIARDEKRAEAARLAAVPFGKLNAPATDLIIAGKLRPVRENVWAVRSTDGKREYTATSLSCECRAAAFGYLCKHRCAAAMGDAAREVA
jgi:hypothetical protein